MFNTYNLRGGSTDVYVKQTVTEKRAPTDDSVRLLMEMEDKALDKLVSITKLENNFFKATWHTFDDYMNGGLNIICRFELNGKEEKFDFKICKFECRNDQELIEKVREKVLERLSRIFTYELFSHGLKPFEGLRRR